MNSLNCLKFHVYNNIKGFQDINLSPTFLVKRQQND